MRPYWGRMGKAHGENHDLKRKRGMCSGRPGVQNFEKAILPGVPCNGRATRVRIRED